MNINDFGELQVASWIREDQISLSMRWQYQRFEDQFVDAFQILDRHAHASAIILALYQEKTGISRGVTYSRNRNHYTVPRRYKSHLYGYRAVVEAVDGLDALGVIDHDRAPIGRLGRQSSMQLTNEAVDTVSKILCERPRLIPLRETIVLRDNDKQLANYRDTRRTNEMRKDVAAQNEALAGADIECISPVTPLRRIFNGNFGLGGRFYPEGGAWQCLSKKDRLAIQISGEPVVEVDYSTFHPAIAYAEIGQIPPAGTYEFPPFPRAMSKIAFNVLLNSSSRNGARYTIATKPEMAAFILGDECPERNRERPITSVSDEIARRYPAFMQDASRTADQLIDAILVKHAPISGAFFSGAGLRFQRLDSDIAQRVMARMRKRGFVVLPVHDSFIVQASAGPELESIMIDEAAKSRMIISCKTSG